MFLQPVLLDYKTNNRIWIRDGNRVAWAAPHGAYRCKGDDEWCAIAVETDEQWQSFYNAIGSPDWTKLPKFATLSDRKQNEDELNDLVTQWTIDFTPHEVMEKLQAAGVPAGAVQNSGDVVQDPQHNARGYFQILEHPEIGPHEYIRSNFILSETPGELKQPAPLLGEHTEYVLCELLQMPSDDFDQLLVEGVFQ
jgi:benzylsuccinate CoA-transferase BbsF subunit